MYLAEMCWKEAEGVLKKPDTVIVIPVGSTEQHGCVGPLGTDWMIPNEFARRLSDLAGVVVAPPVCYGVAPHHTSFPGTVDIGLETMIALMESLLNSWFNHGARRFLILNGHGGNDPALDRAGLTIYRRGGLVSVINWWTVAPQLNPEWITGHGDAQEVAAMMAIRPELIKPEYYADTQVDPLTDDVRPCHLNAATFKGATVRVIRDVRDTVSTGGFGGLDARRATRQWGMAMMDGVTQWMKNYVAQFQQMPIGQGRYQKENQSI
ncbi:MAG TPA: creatininase family protein [Candidatus Aphodousia gallistercoris]|nr:creatininase family protein [Candidatus Aphodousia gallistercoris]